MSPNFGPPKSGDIGNVFWKQLETTREHRITKPSRGDDSPDVAAWWFCDLRGTSRHLRGRVALLHLPRWR
ncbi:hypothetical protein RRSWK_04452 [Rhodopirellula sp. SWK7]|nr:hypothetical protein RRSWK_04452 [Rhodopirellula sp. SWK7]